jgi:hypothetical protein
MKFSAGNFTVFAITGFACFIFLGGICYSWHEETHILLSNKMFNVLPPYFRDITKRDEKKYMLGIQEGEELFPDAATGEEYRAGNFEQRGMERTISAVQQLGILMKRKAPASQIAYQMGRLERLIEDYLEPLPGEDSGFSSVEIAGTRIYFEDDFEEHVKKLDFLFNGYDLLNYLPTALAETMDKNRRSALIIYDAYHRGKGYEAVADEVEATVNRALNLVVDFYYTMDRQRTSLGGKMNLSEFLGLDRFHLGTGGTKKMDIKKPELPPAPATPKKPEVEKK